MMSDDKANKGIDRRGALECMIWAGTGIVWTLSGGVPKSSRLLGIEAAEAAGKAVAGFSFLQISDSHVGFNKPANPDALGTLKEAIGKVNGLPAKPAFMIHTGDSLISRRPGNSTMRKKSSAKPNSMFIMCRASTTSSTRTMARPISAALAKTQRAPAGILSMPAACISSASSMPPI